ncbi:kinase-like domain-containing protein [Rhizophagus irregularis DAOM 181602=DAOM 197198]|nr:kinase-like domain-containing protein [Rhizophagus irregularis DAOM 181602=DAOM 197198]POG58258.1 kinase-like domain-containing protein [Rhizophagus irregularis DAOM 181602=DAOM 197198]|eukprot:XP_025165124.1 kinase-like domain-containing protein [Rhizophagus irregularis DAOM 181602=DAOM 197198]
MEFLDQIVKTHLQLHDSNMIIQYYGMTRYPETDDYMIVMEYAIQGSVRSYLNGRFNTMDWYGKINILSSIVQGLEYIHSSGYVHYNFHVGNVLITGTGETLITDIGIKKPTIKFTSVLRDKEEIYGVLPYLAPEVLYSKRFTSASDIYSFGVMMNEIISGLPPFNSVAHDDHLAAEICFGKRPEIPMHTPKLLEDLIKRCWDMNPSSRPSAKELKDLITQWWNDIQNDKETEIHAQCKASDEVSRNSTFTPTPLLYVSHPEAVYHSRLLEFNNLPKPNKANRRSKLPSSLPYSESRQIDSVASEYQDEDPSDETVSCICPFNNIVNWINSFYKKHKIKK